MPLTPDSWDLSVACAYMPYEDYCDMRGEEPKDAYRGCIVEIKNGEARVLALPGIPDHHRIFKAISPLVVVTIFEQGQGPHPGPLDYMHLYVHTDDGFVQMGQKNRIPKDFDADKWAADCLRKRVKTRLQAEERAFTEFQQAKADIIAIRQAQDSMAT